MPTFAPYGLGIFSETVFGVPTGSSVSSQLFATPTGYDGITLEWSLPESVLWTEQVLVRSSYGFPLTPADGVTLVSETSQESGGVTTYIVDTPVASGRFYYYSLFLYSVSLGEFVVAATAQSVVVGDYGFQDHYTAWLPSFYFDMDADLVPASSTAEGPLTRFMGLLGYETDWIRTDIQSLMLLTDPELAPGVVLPYFAYNFGVEYEGGLGMTQSRLIVKNAAYIYKMKGTAAGVQAVSSAFSGFGVDVAIGKNLLVQLDDGAFDKSGGHWAPSQLVSNNTSTISAAGASVYGVTPPHTAYVPVPSVQEVPSAGYLPFSNENVGLATAGADLVGWTYPPSSYTDSRPGEMFAYYAPHGAVLGLGGLVGGVPTSEGDLITNTPSGSSFTALPARDYEQPVPYSSSGPYLSTYFFDGTYIRVVFTTQYLLNNNPVVTYATAPWLGSSFGAPSALETVAWGTPPSIDYEGLITFLDPNTNKVFGIVPDGTTFITLCGDFASNTVPATVASIQVEWDSTSNTWVETAFTPPPGYGGSICINPATNNPLYFGGVVGASGSTPTMTSGLYEWNGSQWSLVVVSGAMEEAPSQAWDQFDADFFIPQFFSYSGTVYFAGSVTVVGSTTTSYPVLYSWDPGTSAWALLGYLPSLLAGAASLFYPLNGLPWSVTLNARTPRFVDPVSDDLWFPYIGGAALAVGVNMAEVLGAVSSSGPGTLTSTTTLLPVLPSTATAGLGGVVANDVAQGADVAAPFYDPVSKRVLVIVGGGAFLVYEPPTSVSVGTPGAYDCTPVYTAPAGRANGVLAQLGGAYTDTVLLFGGLNADGATFSAETWLYEGEWRWVWGAGPPARQYAAAAMNPSSGDLVLFGGMGGSVASPTVLDDVWVFSPATQAWSSLAPASSPPARYGAGFAYDESSGNFLLFGGVGAAGAVLGDVWVFDQAAVTWTSLTPSVVPLARSFAVMVLDPLSNQIILTGGENLSLATPAYFSDLWVWNGTTWVQGASTTTPAVLFDTVGGVMDPSLGALVLYGTTLSAQTSYYFDSGVASYLALTTCTPSTTEVLGLPVPSSLSEPLVASFYIQPVVTGLPQVGIVTDLIGAPPAPAVAVEGTSGSTPYDYAVTAVTSVGETMLSDVGSVTTGNAALSTTDYNLVSWAAVPLAAGSPGNLVYDSNLTNAIAAVGPTWTILGTVGTAAGDINVLSPGTASAGWVIYGALSDVTGTQSRSALVAVTPGQTYTLSCVVDMSGATAGSFRLSMTDDVGNVLTPIVYQNYGASGLISETFVMPSGVSLAEVQGVVIGVTLASGDTISWSQIQLTETSTVEPYEPGPLWTYDVYGRVAGALGLIGSTTALAFEDTGQAVGAPPPSLKSFYAALDWYDAHHAYISSSVGSPVAELGGAWVRPFVAAVPPPEAVSFGMTIWSSEPLLLDHHLIDAVQIEVNTQATPGPSSWSPPRDVQVNLFPLRQNLFSNATGLAGTYGWEAAGATSFSGNAALPPGMAAWPAGATSAFEVSGDGSVAFANTVFPSVNPDVGYTFSWWSLGLPELDASVDFLDANGAVISTTPTASFSWLTNLLPYQDATFDGGVGGWSGGAGEVSVSSVNGYLEVTMGAGPTNNQWVSNTTFIPVIAGATYTFVATVDPGPVATEFWLDLLAFDSSESFVMGNVGATTLCPADEWTPVAPVTLVIPAGVEYVSVSVRLNTAVNDQVFQVTQPGVFMGVVTPDQWIAPAFQQGSLTATAPTGAASAQLTLTPGVDAPGTGTWYFSALLLEPVSYVRPYFDAEFSPSTDYFFEGVPNESVSDYYPLLVNKLTRLAAVLPDYLPIGATFSLITGADAFANVGLVS